MVSKDHISKKKKGRSYLWKVAHQNPASWPVQKSLRTTIKTFKASDYWSLPMLHRTGRSVRRSSSSKFETNSSAIPLAKRNNGDSVQARRGNREYWRLDAWSPLHAPQTQKTILSLFISNWRKSLDRPSSMTVFSDAERRRHFPLPDSLAMQTHSNPRIWLQAKFSFRHYIKLNFEAFFSSLLFVKTLGSSQTSNSLPCLDESRQPHSNNLY